MTRSIALRRRPILAAIIVGLVLLGLCVALFNPITVLQDAVTTARVRWELPRAVERWRASGIEDYRIHVRGAVPLACLVDGELEVRGKELSGVLIRENPFVPGSPLVPVDRADWGRATCPYKDLRVEQMFDRVEKDLDRLGFLGGPLLVDFDEERGYVTEYRLGRASQGGLLAPVVSECCTWFTFDSLVVLPSG